MNVWYCDLRGGSVGDGSVGGGRSRCGRSPTEPLPTEPPQAGLSQPGIVVRPIRPDEADLWVRTAFQGGLDSDDARPARTAIIAAYPYMAHSVCYLAWLDGQPAGAGTLALHAGVAELFGASTRPRFRGRGVQTALLAARLADAARAGCDLATVHTEPGAASQRNVERFGFRLAYTRLMLRRE
jgi:GNAT superfamily N-acetyltransferase